MTILARIALQEVASSIGTLASSDWKRFIKMIWRKTYAGRVDSSPRSIDDTHVAKVFRLYRKMRCGHHDCP